MRSLFAVLLAAMLAGCSLTAREHTDPRNTPPPTAGLPSPAELDQAHLRSTSGTLDGPERIIQIRPHLLTTWYPSRNAVPDSDPESPTAFTAVVHPSMTELNYALYQVANFAFAAGDTLREVCVEADYGGPLDDGPVGLHLVFANHNTGRWVSHKVDSLGRWMDVAHLEFQGRDEGLHSYIALVNYSSNAALLRNIYLRFSKSGDVHDDEWIYFSQALDETLSDPTEVTSILMVRPDGSDTQPVLAGAFPDPPPGGSPLLTYRDPIVGMTPGGLRLRYTHRGPNLWHEAWESAPDGRDPAPYMASASMHIYAAPGSPDGSVSAWLLDENSGPPFHDNYVSLNLRNESTSESGRYSAPGFIMADPVWDNRSDFDGHYRMLASMADPTTGGEYLVVSLYDAPPAVDTASAGLLYAREPTETDARYPSVMRLIAHTELLHVVYTFFSSVDRGGHPHFALYAYAPDTYVMLDPTVFGTSVKLWLADGAADIVNCVASPDGTRIAYVVRPAGSPLGTLYVLQNFQSDAVPVAVAEHVVGRVCWYDPTP